ncbi:MAG: hypothetical protein IJO28_03710 [Oscillospiraceae bacterium]|nr:hypothetical protein [Oscillospiraceae bacterium]
MDKAFLPAVPEDLKFQFVEQLLALNCRLMGGAMLCIARERIATPVILTEV